MPYSKYGLNIKQIYNVEYHIKTALINVVTDVHFEDNYIGDIVQYMLSDENALAKCVYVMYYVKIWRVKVWKLLLSLF